MQVVKEVYDQKMDHLRSSITHPIHVAADGRSDSPGHSALYGITTMMDAESRMIVASNLVRVCNFPHILSLLPFLIL